MAAQSRPLPGRSPRFIASTARAALVVTGMHSAGLDCTAIPAGTDFHGFLSAAIWERDSGHGWTVENDGSYGFVFCRKTDVRRLVAIVPVDPARPVVGTYPAPPAPA